MKPREAIWKCIRSIDLTLLGLLYPKRCPFCDRAVLPGEGICKECAVKAHFVKEPACMKCGKPLMDARREYCRDCGKKSHAFTQGKAVFLYEKETKAALYRFKYQNKREYADVFAKEMATRYGDWIKQKRIQAIVPVPLHKRRRKKRGFNQAEVLAKELGRELGIPVLTNLLIRVRDTRPQKELNEAERKNNLKRAFKISGSIVQLDYILLLDDIYTTGSTLDAAAAALLAAGAREVYACCVGIGGDG